MQLESLIVKVRRLVRHLSKRRKNQLIAFVPLMFVGAFAELATLGAVLPFLSLLSDPTSASRFSLLESFFSYFGLESDHGILLPATVLFAAVAVCASVVRMFITWVSFKLTFAIGFDIGVDVYRRTLYQPYSFHVSNNTSEIISGVNKVRDVVFNVISPLVQSVVSLVVSLVILVGLLQIDASVAITAGFGFSVIYVFVTLATRRRLRVNSKIAAAAETTRVQAIQEGLGGIRDVLIDGAQEVYVNRFARVDAAQRKAQASNLFVSSSPRYLIESIGMVLIAAIAYWLSGREGGLNAAIPTLGALAIGAQRMLPQMQQIYQGWATANANRAALDDVLHLLDQRIPVEYQKVVSPSELYLGSEIRVRDVHYRYSHSGPLVLRDISMSIPKGSRIGFVGKTGSGKSTLIDLIMGLLEPTSGAIEIDGTAITAANRRAWHLRVAHVPQTIFLSDASIAGNIAFGIESDNVDIARVEAAARMAEIADYIEILPNKYETQVGERGVRLSGGQRQRIGIARALYKRADVLVLDEATSALDEATEKLVINNIIANSEITIIMIAHRVSTLRGCSIIYELTGGTLREYKYSLT